jgi:hypothetical protein
MDAMDFEVLPGPSLAELARTALASAETAEIDDAGRPGEPARPGRLPVLASVRDGRDGSPLLLSVTGSARRRPTRCGGKRPACCGTWSTRT